MAVNLQFVQGRRSGKGKPVLGEMTDTASYNLIHNETTPTGDAACARGRTSVERGSQLWMLTVSNNKFDIKSKSK